MRGPDWGQHPASFRDPAGYVFEAEGILYRAVRARAEDDLRALTDSGLYAELVADGLLVAHADLGRAALGFGEDYRVLRPERVPVVSYPSEWTFAQLKAAALLTLEVQRRALRRGLCLKDASAFNVQFRGARPVFIDTLSFTRASGDGPWLAYRQFCEHFLGPLALVAYRGHATGRLWSASVEGVPLAVASELLPWSTWCRAGLLAHLHLHSRAGTRSRQPAALPSRSDERDAKVLPGFAMRLAGSLRGAVEALRWAPRGASGWSTYRSANSYSDTDSAAKIDFVRRCVVESMPSRALDLGANDGLYSSLLAQSGVAVTAVETDALCTERLFEMTADSWPDKINTLRVDLANPTPAHGWAGRERADLVSRVRCDLVLALALIHHLAIARNVPYPRIAAYFAELGTNLVVEYVPPTDPMASLLLQARSDAHDLESYGEAAFLEAFTRWYEISMRSQTLAGGRHVFLMRRRSDLP